MPVSMKESSVALFFEWTTIGITFLKCLFHCLRRNGLFKKKKENSLETAKAYKSKSSFGVKLT